MKLILLIFFLVAIAENSVSQPPSNDECSGAYELQVLDFSETCGNTQKYSTSGATMSVPGISCTGNYHDDDIWFKFTAGSASVFIEILNPVNESTGARALIGFEVYKGSCGSFTGFYCNNLASSSYQVISDLTPGETYYLRTWTTLTGNSPGSFSLCLKNMPPPPANDDCENAFEITTVADSIGCNIPFESTTLSATASSPLAGCGSQQSDDDVWYSFTAIETGIRFELNEAIDVIRGGRANLALSVYEEECPAEGNEIYCHSNIGSGNSEVDIGGLIPGKKYFLRLRSYYEGQYVNFSFCLKHIPLIENDECSAAIELPVTDGINLMPVLGDLSPSTPSSGFGSPSCAVLSLDDDIWFKVIVPESGKLSIQTTAYGLVSQHSMVLEAFRGGCENAVSLGCSLNGNTDRPSLYPYPRLNLNGLIPGEELLIRLTPGNFLNKIKFLIMAVDPEAELPAIAESGNCELPDPVKISMAGFTCFRWVPIYNSEGLLVARIFSYGKELEEVQAAVKTSDDISIKDSMYLAPRSYSFNSTESFANVWMEVFLTEEEFLQLQSANPVIEKISDLRIAHKEEGNCGDSLTDNYNTIIPDSAGIYSGGYFIKFVTDRFSSFYIYGTDEVLPLKFTGIKIYKEHSKNTISFTVISEENIRNFEIQKAIDGVNFQSTGNIDYSEGRIIAIDELEYKWTDPDLTLTKAFYRVKMITKDGKTLYSQIVSSLPANPGSVYVYPQPARDHLFISSSNKMYYDIHIYDINGRVLMKFSINNTTGIMSLPVSRLSSGVYFINLIESGGKNMISFKFIKQ